MNGKIILIALCGLAIPFQLLCMNMNVEQMAPEELQQRLDDYDQHINHLRADVAARNQAWHTSRSRFENFIPAGLSCGILLNKFSAGHWPRLHRLAYLLAPKSLYDWGRKHFADISWPRCIAYSAVAGAFSYVAMRSLLQTRRGKSLSSVHRELARLKHELSTQQNERDMLYRRVQQQLQNAPQRAAGAAANNAALDAQHQADQAEIARLQQAAAAAQGDIAFARHQNEDYERIKRENPDRIPHQECPICMDDSDDMIRLDCGHTFCRGCLRGAPNAQGVIEGGVVGTALAARNSAELLCPNLQCHPAGQQRTVLSDNDIRRIVELDENPQETWDRYNQIKFDEFVRGLGPDARACPTPDCQNMWMFEHRDGEADAGRYDCPVCHRACCQNCRVPWNMHEARNCDQARAEKARLDAMSPEQRKAQDGDRQLNQYLEQHGGLRCPRCLGFMERQVGCDHMVCGRDTHGHGRGNGCGYDFCIRCLLPMQRTMFENDHAMNGAPQWFGGACDHALQLGVRRNDPWALELQRWIAEDPANRHPGGDARGENGGRAHLLELYNQRGREGVAQLLNIRI